MSAWEAYQCLNNQVASLGFPSLRAPKIAHRSISSASLHLLLDDPGTSGRSLERAPLFTVPTLR
eukprot:12898797-Prorocentrum_lima.AAC.1